MTEQKVLRIVRQTVEEIFEIEGAEILRQADLVEDLGGDSLKTLELIGALERRFKIRYTPLEAQEIATVADVLRHTLSHVG